METGLQVVTRGTAGPRAVCRRGTVWLRAGTWTHRCGSLLSSEQARHKARAGGHRSQPVSQQGQWISGSLKQLLRVTQSNLSRELLVDMLPPFQLELNVRLRDGRKHGPMEENPQDWVCEPHRKEGIEPTSSNIDRKGSGTSVALKPGPAVQGTQPRARVLGDFTFELLWEQKHSPTLFYFKQSEMVSFATTTCKAPLAHSR